MGQPLGGEGFRPFIEGQVARDECGPAPVFESGTKPNSSMISSLALAICL